MWKYDDGANNYLAHHGVKGQKWGVRQYQNPDGTLTEEGRRRYLTSDGIFNKEKWDADRAKENSELNEYKEKSKKRLDKYYDRSIEKASKQALSLIDKFDRLNFSNEEKILKKRSETIDKLTNVHLLSGMKELEKSKIMNMDYEQMKKEKSHVAKINAGFAALNSLSLAATTAAIASGVPLVPVVGFGKNNNAIRTEHRTDTSERAKAYIDAKEKAKLEFNRKFHL